MFLDIVKKIEAQREYLKQSLEFVEIVDYGAGKPEDKRTKEQMQRGVVSKVSLENLASIGVKKEKAEQIYGIFKDLKPEKILELGTCCGFSSSYFSLFAPNARIYTIEGSPNVAKIARENHKSLGLSNIEVIEGRFDLVLPKLLEKIAPLDFAFIDGHHNKDATLEYFKQILPFMQRGGVMLFDDIAWSLGMQEAWAEILESKVYVESKDFGWMGAIWL